MKKREKKNKEMKYNKYQEYVTKWSHLSNYTYLLLLFL